MHIALISVALSLIAAFLDTVFASMMWKDKIRRYFYLLVANFIALVFIEKRLEPKYIIREALPLTENTVYEEKEIDNILNNEL